MKHEYTSPAFTVISCEALIDEERSIYHFIVNKALSGLKDRKEEK